MYVRIPSKGVEESATLGYFYDCLKTGLSQEADLVIIVA
jgi:hypothetical protein